MPTAKEKKYDRQLRLWGAAGQVALEESHVLLINNGAGVAGVETLKNIVLPGVGNFSILDSATVSDEDLHVHFFLEQRSRGQLRAEETVKYLTELNPDVHGRAITAPLATWAAQDDILQPYTLVLVAAPLDPAVFAAVERQIHAREIPTFYIHCVGFYAQFSLSLPHAFPLVHTHPDPTATTDLRLLKPWPALTEFADQHTADMQHMDAETFAHIPYVCLLLHYLAQWKATHDGRLPSTYRDKTAFRDLVRSGSSTEENFDEACAAVLKSLQPPVPPPSLQLIFSEPEACHLDPTTSNFWIILMAIKEFDRECGQLPLPGAVPDMKARSDTYVQLQNIYKQKAREDVQKVLAAVRRFEKMARRTPEMAIDVKEVENFCKGAAHVSLVRGAPFKVPQADSPVTFGKRAKYLVHELTNPESLVGIYIAFLAWDIYTATHTTSASEAGGEAVKVPGIGDDWETDVEKLTGIAHKTIDSLINEAGTRIEDPEYTQVKESVGKYCLELARAGGGELHNVASLTGGLVAQEAIKVITKQYVPINNTCVFDAITSRSWVGQI